MGIFEKGRQSLLGLCFCLLSAIVFTVALSPVEARAQDRTLHIHVTHTKETVRVTYMRNGRYDEAALRQLNHVLRDWRQNRSVRMDPELFDILWEIYRRVNASGPIHVVSAYRSPQTNNALRSRSRQVAQTSEHMRGKAIDFYIPSVDMSRVREIALQMQRGGVGWYPSSGSRFVHVDTGSIRHWPRVSRQQLSRLFPDGKTVHIPSDGRPMARYEEAARELAAQGRAPSGVAQQLARAGGANTPRARSSGGNNQPANFNDDPSALIPPTPGNNIFALLFGDSEDEDEETAAAQGGAPAAAPSQPVNVTPARTVELAAAPVPQSAQRPQEAASAQVAEATPDLPEITLAEAPIPPRNPLRARREPEVNVQLAEAPIPPLRARREPEGPIAQLIAENQDLEPLDLASAGQQQVASADQAFDTSAVVAYARDDSAADRIEALLREEAGLSIMDQSRPTLAALSGQSRFEGYEWLNRTSGPAPELLAQDANWRFVSPSQYRKVERSSAFAEAPLTFRLMRLNSPLTKAPKWVMMDGFSFDNAMMDVGRFSGSATQAIRLKGPFEPNRTTTASLQRSRSQ